MMEEFQEVILTIDLPNSRLQSGDVGSVVDVLADGKAYIVEFMTMAGDITDIVILEAHQVRLIERADMPHARTLSVPHAGLE